jgi:disease resistance protein RPM1
VVTTRIQTVARAIVHQQQNACIYSQKPLSEENSCKLFHRIISDAGDDICPTRPINGKIIMKICRGIPLAIILLAGLVASRLRSETGSNIDLHLSQIGEGLSEDLESPLKRLIQILDQCYNPLPADLKICLLCLSIFPNKGCWISRNRLIRRWIAERLIAERHQKTVEEVAKDYFNELIARNLIWEVNYRGGKVKSFQVHDIVLEYIIAKSNAEDFITIVGGHWKMPVPRNKVRRLSIHNSNTSDSKVIGELELSHLRTLSVFKSSIVLHSPSLNFQRLQLLDLEGCKDLTWHLLDKICNMHQLRYLSLRRTNIAEIPYKIYKLKHLELLDIRETDVINLPASVDRLQGMTHLLVGNKTQRIALTLTEGILKMTALQTLSMVCCVPDFFCLRHLRVLSITWYFHQCTDRAWQKALCSSIEYSLNLQSLSIHCDGLGCIMEFLGSITHPPTELEKFKVTSGTFVNVPQWIECLKHLAFLQITVCKLASDDLKILMNLLNLQYLILGLEFIPREEIEIENKGFNELLKLSVDCPVPWLTFRQGAMPKLMCLELKFCSGTTSQRAVPSGIGNLRRITEVALSYNQKWCDSSSSVKMTVEAVKKEVAKHCNQIDLIINGSKIDVQEVQEKDMATGIQIETEGEAKDDVQAVGEETKRITSESEIQEIDVDTGTSP